MTAIFKPSVLTCDECDHEPAHWYLSRESAAGEHLANRFVCGWCKRDILADDSAKQRKVNAWPIVPNALEITATGQIGLGL